MAAGRIVLRRQWKADHPPQFNRSRRVLALGRPVRPRMSFALWMIKTFQPERYRHLESLALRRASEKNGKELEAHAAAEERKTFEEVAS